MSDIYYKNINDKLKKLDNSFTSSNPKILYKNRNEKDFIRNKYTRIDLMILAKNFYPSKDIKKERMNLRMFMCFYFEKEDRLYIFNKENINNITDLIRFMLSYDKYDDKFIGTLYRVYKYGLY